MDECLDIHCNYCEQSANMSNKLCKTLVLLKDCWLQSPNGMVDVTDSIGTHVINLFGGKEEATLKVV